MRDQEEIAISDFKGLWDRDDNFPLGYGSIFTNIRFDNNAVFTRESIFIRFELQITLGLFPTDRVIQFWPYRPSSAPFTQRYLVLVQNDVNTNGRIYDTGATIASTPILSIGAMTAASVLQLFDRMYISPRLTGSLVFVYANTFLPQLARAIAGIAPATVPTAAVGGAGNCEPGLHLISVAFETNTGFITKPARAAGVSLSTQVTVPSGTPSTINLTAIPTGPVGTVKRHILMTKVIPRFDGNTENYQFFFAGVLNDNVTTVLNISIFDSQMVASADYLYDLKELVESGLALAVHGGSLLVCGPFDDIYLVRVSKNGEPESFSAVDGYCIVGKGDGGRVTRANSFRGDIITFKGRRTYSIQPNDGPPNTWAVITIDIGKGTGSDGVATVVDSPSGTNQEGLFVMSLDGLWFFDGSYSQLPLSWVIEGQWGNLVNRGSMRHFACVDPISSRLFVVLSPIYSGAGGAAKMLVCDFSDGITFDKVRWSEWKNNVGGLPSFMHVEPRSISGVETSQLIFSQYNQPEIDLKGHLLDRVVGLYDFIGSVPVVFPIIWEFNIGNVSIPGAEVATWIGTRLRGRGSAIFNIGIIGAGATQYSDIDWPLSSKFQNFGYTRRHINFTAERIDLFSLINNSSGIDSSMEIKELILYGKPTWNRL